MKVEKNLKFIASLSMVLVVHSYGYPLWILLRPDGDIPFGQAWQYPEVRSGIAYLAVIFFLFLFFAASIIVRLINRSRELLFIALILIFSAVSLVLSLNAAYTLWFSEWRFAAGLHILRAGLLLFSCVSAVAYLVVVRMRSNQALQRTNR
jgi:hypothetical protein